MSLTSPSTKNPHASNEAMHPSSNKCNVCKSVSSFGPECIRVCVFILPSLLQCHGGRMFVAYNHKIDIARIPESLHREDIL